MSDENERETYYFDTDVLSYSVKVDHARGKVYKAGKAFGIEPGYVLVEDMKTGESRIVPANASGTRPLNKSPGKNPDVF